MSTTDRQAWTDMRSKFWGHLSKAEHLSDIDWMLSDGQERSGFIAEKDSSTVGFTEVCIRDFANGCTSQPVPFLEGIWVVSEYRKQGVGRMLVGSVEQYVIGMGYKELCSDANIDNLTSHHAHEGWGFAETERVVYFRKPL
ncbi:MAG: GNAT family N-acetyltransferase [Pseudomonadota bacterium]